MTLPGKGEMEGNEFTVRLEPFCSGGGLISLEVLDSICEYRGPRTLRGIIAKTFDPERDRCAVFWCVCGADRHVYQKGREERGKGVEDTL